MEPASTHVAVTTAVPVAAVVALATGHSTMNTATTGEVKHSGYRTLQMVRALTSDVRWIVVHTAQMKVYIEYMLKSVRPDLVVAPSVIVVTSVRDCDRLRGQHFVVDHAALEHASPEVHTLLRALDRPSLAQHSRACECATCLGGSN